MQKIKLSCTRLQKVIGSSVISVRDNPGAYSSLKDEVYIVTTTFLAVRSANIYVTFPLNIFQCNPKR